MAVLKETSIIGRRSACRLAVTNHRSFSSNVVSVAKDRSVEYYLFTMCMKGSMVVVLVVDLVIIGQMEGSSSHDAVRVE